MKIRQFLSKHSKLILYSALVAVITYLIFIPTNFGYADFFAYPTEQVKVTYKLPEVQDKIMQRVVDVRVTAYSSTPDQCSGNPFITASGSHVHDGTIAANCLPFGTIVKFPEIYGDKEFVVEDRSAPRWGCNSFDIWMTDRGSALAFGKAYTTVEIYN